FHYVSQPDEIIAEWQRRRFISEMLNVLTRNARFFKTEDQTRPRPSGKLNARNLRKRALPHLLKDFERRCAYSMRHVQIAGGLLHMEIDHFNPTLKSRARNAYSNLMLATRLCNNIKKDAWPTPNDIAAGARLLNPTVEMDYGE